MILPTWMLPVSIALAMLATDPPAPRQQTKYYYAAGQNSSLQQHYKAVSNVFALDCRLPSSSDIGPQFSNFYKAEYSRGSDDWIQGYLYGPYDTPEAANKARYAKIAAMKQWCEEPKCFFTMATGFRPSCK